jgi:predicted RNA binding protein YcfA (HicA-like mRNA interferase family)
VPSNIPVVPGVKVVKALESAGFTVARINGSHHVMEHPDGRAVPVAVHAGKDMPRGTLRNILAIIGMTPEEFRALL